MQSRYPGATWKPLGTQTEPLITPRILVFHTMAGYLGGSDSHFRRGNGAGYDGPEAHFGVGGPWDKGLDGAVWQWQDCNRQADAQAWGNGYCTSIETSDGAVSSRPWSSKQIAALVSLATWWCRQTGAPARLVTSVSGSGFGYHSQFAAWNPSGHACPGSVRVNQLKTIVIPAVADLLTPKPKPPTTVPATNASKPKLTRVLRRTSPLMRGSDVTAVQAKVGAGRDGAYGPDTEAAVTRAQRAKGLTPDGVVGPKTAAALGFAWAPPLSA